MAIKTTNSINVYPSTFPLPDAPGYSAQVDYGILRSNVGGYPDQCRSRFSNPTLLRVTFMMTQEMYVAWSDWVDHFGTTQWVSMPLVHAYDNPGRVDPISDEIVRFSDLSMSVVGYNHVRVSCDLEIMPRDIGKALHGNVNPIVSPGLSDWIVAGSPDAPSVDWIVAGDPPTPSNPDWVNPKTPADHI